MAKRKIFWRDSTAKEYYLENTQGEMVKKFPLCCDKCKTKPDLESTYKTECLYCESFEKYVKDRFKRSWKREQLKLDVKLDNTLIMFENADSNKIPTTFSLLGKNLGHIFGNYDFENAPIMLTYFIDGYNVRGEIMNVEMGNVDTLLFRKLKSGINEYDFVIAMREKGNKITRKDINEYTESILPLLKSQYNM